MIHKMDFTAKNLSSNAGIYLLLENEAVFQMMMLSYNLFLLFKFDSLHTSEYRQQLKTFLLNNMYLAAKIIRTARYVVMKLSAKYPYKDVYERCLS